MAGSSETGETDDTPLQELLAQSMDAPAELLPVLPQLVEDLEDLGARSDDVLDVLATLPIPGLTARHRVLDLGCGKGAAALAIAQASGAQVLGIDGLPGFIDHARARAAQLELSSRCRFAVGDLRAHVDAQGEQGEQEQQGAADDGGKVDLVMMLALGDVLGDVETTVARLRRCVVPGGHMLIDGAYLGRPSQPSDDPQLAEAYGTRSEARAELSSLGDVIVTERVVDGADGEAHYRGVTDRIDERAAQLAAAHPELASSILAFADRQREAIATLAGPVVGCLWLLRRV